MAKGGKAGNVMQGVGGIGGALSGMSGGGPFSSLGLSGGSGTPSLGPATSLTGGSLAPYDPMAAASELGGKPEGLPWKQILGYALSNAGRGMEQGQGGGQALPIDAPPPPPSNYENPWAQLVKPLYPMSY